MLWLAVYFPHLPLEVFIPDEPGQALAVTRLHRGVALIDRCNQSALDAGIRSGMRLSDALSLLPGLQVRERQAELERQALDTLAACAWRYSSRISFDPLLLLLEVGSSLQLFGGLDALLEAVLSDLRSEGYELQYALAMTPAAASLLARVKPGCRAEDGDMLQRELADIGLRQLTRRQQPLRLLAGIGLATIGDCLSLPRPELARRAGPELMQLLERLLGRQPDPRTFWKPRERFEQHLPLLTEIEHTPALLFPARRLLRNLVRFLEGHDANVQQLKWIFRHREQAATILEQGLLQPSRAMEIILDLLRQRLENLALPEAVVEIGLQVRHWQPASIMPADLFDVSETADGYLLDRLRARLGDEAIKAVICRDEYRPERAWQYREPDKKPVGQSSRKRAGRQLPVWLLPEPEPLVMRQGRLWYRGVLELKTFLQRIENAWWEEDGVARDYYRAFSPAGISLWVFRERRGRQWFVHGLFG